MANAKLVLIAGGSGFIGRAIARRLAALAEPRVRIMSRNPARARQLLPDSPIEFVAGEVTQPQSLPAAMAGVDCVINAVQFDGYPVEDAARGLTFERIDYGGTLALLESAKAAGTGRFIYISGASADPLSSHPGFRAKGQAERAIGQSGLEFTIFRPSLVFGREDRTVNLFAKALRYSPIFAVPGTGLQRVQPVWIEDVAAAVALALTNPAARNRCFEIGGPQPMSFDDFMRLLMDITGHHRPLFHVPEGLLRMVGRVVEKLPRPVLSADAVTFLTADHLCDTQPLVAALGVRLTPLRQALSYLAPAAA
ncbi:MAG TPA: NAD-dependent epimerase/dehydratase family protein [Candidatus Binataceae bacterium]|nr:NAD-dependent epimerase/dehydratase family protein [Candidatus Binataceae bacterium]